MPVPSSRKILTNFQNNFEQMKLKSIKEQVVVIFGASSGIGRATALKMASKGAKVAVVARSKTGIESLVAEIKNSGGEALGIIAGFSMNFTFLISRLHRSQTSSSCS
jgi:ethanolamine utilization microcompartment shell protein EutL